MKITINGGLFGHCKTGIHIERDDVELITNNLTIRDAETAVAVVEPKPAKSGGFVAGVASGVTATAISRIMGM